MGRICINPGHFGSMSGYSNQGHQHQILTARFYQTCYVWYIPPLVTLLPSGHGGLYMSVELVIRQLWYILPGDVPIPGVSRFRILYITKIRPEIYD